MSQFRTAGADRLHSRRWLFAGCVFDEANWTLVVDGRRVAIEAKPLELLRELLIGGGQLVTKDELLDRIWPDVHVVEASLTTAVHKLRQALGEDRRKRRIIETVPGLGYRLNVPATSEELVPASAPPPRPAAAPAEPSEPFWLMPRLLSIAGGLAIAVAAVAVAFGPPDEPQAAAPAAKYTQRQAADAIRELDIGTIKQMIAAGWNPAAPWDKEGNDALNALLNICEWDPGHDRRQMLLMARVLLEGGAAIDHRNVWGDTPYSIAKAPRYCGPDHPVTQMLEAMCYGGSMGPKDRCLATYELTAAQRKAQGLPPKS